MPGPIDAIMGLMSQFNPGQQLGQALQGPNPSPMAPGGPQAGAGGAPGAGGPPGPGAPPAGTGGPPQAPGQGSGGPPTPQLYQTPPDMAAMNQQLASPGNLIKTYMDMQARQYQGEQFNRGLAMLLGGMKGPPNQLQEMVNASQGLQPSAHQTMSDIMQLYNTQYEMQMRAQLTQNLPKMLADAGISQDYAPYIMANPSLLGDIIKTRMGVTGDPSERELQAARNDWRTQNPGKTDSDMLQARPELANATTYKANTEATAAAATTQARTQEADLVADKHNFGPALANYDKSLKAIDQFLTPDMQEGAQEFLGTAGQLRPVATMSAKGKAAYALYKQIMASQFSAGTADFKGAGRITQQELNQDAPSQSTMGSLNQDPGDFFNGARNYREQLAQHRAMLFGVSQNANDPRLSDADYQKYVEPNMDVYGGPRRQIKQSTQGAGGGGGGEGAPSTQGGGGGPVAVQTPDDVRRLPSGTPFIIPSGAHKGETGYAP